MKKEADTRCGERDAAVERSGGWRGGLEGDAVFWREGWVGGRDYCALQYRAVWYSAVTAFCGVEKRQRCCLREIRSRSAILREERNGNGMRCTDTGFRVGGVRR